PGDEESIEVLLAAGATAASRAPETAARWFSAALRLLPAGDGERQVEVRVALANALRAIGELERCRTNLLEAIELLPPDATTRRVELTTFCAGVEHWRGLHDDAHRRLLRAWEELPERGTPAAAALQIELGVDGLHALDIDQALTMGEGALETSRALGDTMLTAAAASALGLIKATAGRFAEAREHRDEAVPIVDAASDEELAPRLEALFHLGWTENYSEQYDASIAHAERGMEIARATGQGRLLGSLQLVRGFPFQMQGRLAECLETCEQAVEAARLSANPNSLYWALYELAWAHYYAGDLEAAMAAADASLDVDNRLLGGTMPSAGGGPGWVRACCHNELGNPAAALDALNDLNRPDFHVALQRCFDLEVMALARIALGDLAGARADADAAETDAAQLDMCLARCVAGRAPRRGAAGRVRRAGGGGRRRRRRGRRGADRCAAPGRVRARAPGPWAGGRGRAVRGDRGTARRRAHARRVRLGARARRGAPRAAQARGALGAARPGRGRGRRDRLAVEARARDRRADRRPHDQPADRGPAVPQQEDGRVPHPQPVLQARRIVARGCRADRRARA
ncbi:MAG TPA: tetratricopeptide repeat protein, partial [Thermoleophilaceae bacterium]